MIVLIGESPGRNGNPNEPLTGRVGRRLADLAGLSYEEYLKVFWRVNLLAEWPGTNGRGDRFPVEEAKLRAIFQLALMREMKSDRFLFMGKRVAKAFEFPVHSVPDLKWIYHKKIVCAVFPHPSGVSRFWNDPDNEEKARKFLTETVEKFRGA